MTTPGKEGSTMTTTLPAEAGTETAPTERARFIDGLRILALALEQHPEVPLPRTGTSEYQPVRFSFTLCDDPRASMAATARALPCAWRKHYTEAHPDGEYPAYLDLHGAIGGVQVELLARRDDVCKRIVTGTREVTEEVPDPAKLAKVPTVKVTRTVEEVEYDCGPLLRPEIGQG